MIGKSIIGVVAPLSGAAVSLSEINEYLKAASLVVGIVVGVTSWILLIRGKKKD